MEPLWLREGPTPMSFSPYAISHSPRGGAFFVVGCALGVREAGAAPLGDTRAAPLGDTPGGHLAG